MDELLALVGGSWQPLLLYPGILGGLLLSGLMHLTWSGRRAMGDGGLRPWVEPGAVMSAACSLLLLALLPLPRSYWAYPVDIIGALALLEAPHWLRLSRRMRSADASILDGAVAEAASLLNIYLLLALALAAMGQASGSLLLTDLKSGRQPLWWAGIIAWAIAQPPLIGLGPWHPRPGGDWPASLRRVAHVALLTALALPPGDQLGYMVTATGLGIAFGSLTLLDFIWRGRPEAWERLQPAVALMLLGFLLYGGLGAWTSRLR